MPEMKNIFGFFYWDHLNFWSWWIFCPFHLKICHLVRKVHIFWEKFWEISTVDLSYVLSARQIYSGDFAKFCGHLRLYELKVGWVLSDAVVLKEGLYCSMHFQIFFHITPFENPQRWMGQNTFPILLLNDDNMIGEH